ncbi:hypothetical protein N7462_005556, partial [Penicillium macrosclerotiorum]|uniref:uncharacterized protein n=1 Tax=Penicillium macrosclerotiorum TaxID=303699 RepID=UPI0025471D20
KMRPKKVAIIGKCPFSLVIPGAGPSGLVTAKTLLHNFPHGAFTPIIFDSRHEVGGLWPNRASRGQSDEAHGSPGLLDPWMRTNLSRFTVAFSDFSWESVMRDSDIPMFPQAYQVGKYLAAYTKHSARDLNSQQNPSENDIESEDFDLLVVASGYFARPYIPDIPGLKQSSARVVHSSMLDKGRDPVLDAANAAAGDIVVIGGSMSGVETASALALQQSSSMFVQEPTLQVNSKRKIHHIYSRSFWSLPTYLPHETAQDTLAFLPLDLVMYDLGRRPSGLIEYALGPIPEEKARKTNDYFRSLLGTEYEQFGHMQDLSSEPETHSEPPWVAIGNDYSEFVRSGDIEATMGRAISIDPSANSALSSINLETSSGSKTLENVATVVMATGFTPFNSLSFLPEDVLDQLEFTSEDPFLPLILDMGGTIRSEVSDLGFVGFYRGPYWGVMEMQARFLGKMWSQSPDECFKTEDQRASLRVLRHPSPVVRRGQFPMGDYVGLMEELAKNLGIDRAILLAHAESQSGPVIPARYTTWKKSSRAQLQDTATGGAEVQQTLDALQISSSQESPSAKAAASLAIFRALQGTWNFTQSNAATKETGESGTMVFYPRYSSNLKYDREYYVCETSRGADPKLHQTFPFGTPVSVFRLAEFGTSENSSGIEIWSINEGRSTAVDSHLYNLHLSPFYRKKERGIYIPGEYLIHACSMPTAATTEAVPRGYQYTFHFQGVTISRWEFVDLSDVTSGNETHSEKHELPGSRTIYTR